MTYYLLCFVNSKYLSNDIGTKWLIAEHRKCIAEMKKLKIMIADMSKYIGALREKGRELFNSYLALKKHLEVLLLDKLFCIFIQLKKNSLPFTYYLCRN